MDTQEHRGIEESAGGIVTTAQPTRGRIQRLCDSRIGGTAFLFTFNNGNSNRSVDIHIKIDHSIKDVIHGVTAFENGVGIGGVAAELWIALGAS